MKDNVSMVIGLLLVASCSRSHQNDCEAVKACFATGTDGCCTTATTEISVCSTCPAGTLERRSCPTSGCETSCGDAGLIDLPAPQCHVNLGSGCCGEAVWVGECPGECPADTIPTYLCSSFGPECGGCGDRAADRDTAEEFDPRGPCYQDLANGCCGDIVSRDHCGDCPAGALEDYQCNDWAPACGPNCLASDVPPAEPGPPESDAGTGSADPPAGAPCYESFAGGCCGTIVTWIDSGCCPAGSVLDSSCQAFREQFDRAPPAEIIAPDAGPAEPAPRREEDGAPPSGCRRLHDAGCCTWEFVEYDACGQCPAGTLEQSNCDFCG